MRILLLFALFLSACSSTVVRSTGTRKARVTFYSNREDRWGSRTASGVRAREGITVAAPKRIPFGTQIHIPGLEGKIGDGRFIVQDRGSLVEKLDRIDVYVEASSRKHSRKRLKSLSLLNPWQEVRF